MADIINVKVVRVPGTVREVSLEHGSTVNDALTAADMQLGSGETVALNGQTATGSEAVYEGARIIVSKGAKGA